MIKLLIQVYTLYIKFFEQYKILRRQSYFKNKKYFILNLYCLLVYYY